jgi:hypothetical protein
MHIFKNQKGFAVAVAVVVLSVLLIAALGLAGYFL